MHLLPNDTTIATVLSAAGYRTCLVNKWHLDGFNPEATPLNRGFDEFYGWLISTAYSNDPYYYPYWRFEKEELVNIQANADGKHGIHNTDLSTRNAIDFIRRNRENPFCSGPCLNPELRQMTMPQGHCLLKGHLT